MQLDQLQSNNFTESQSAGHQYTQQDSVPNINRANVIKNANLLSGISVPKATKKQALFRS